MIQKSKGNLPFHLFALKRWLRFVQWKTHDDFTIKFAPFIRFDWVLSGIWNHMSCHSIISHSLFIIFISSSPSSENVMPTWHLNLDGNDHPHSKSIEQTNGTGLPRRSWGSLSWFSLPPAGVHIQWLVRQRTSWQGAALKTGGRRSSCSTITRLLSLIW